MKIGALDRPARLPARLAEVLLNEIGEGRLQPGDRLPTEHYLAKNFGVSRNVVREAIAQLRSAGVVSSRQGLGTIVAESGPGRLFRLDQKSGADPSSFRHVYELRMAIEIQAAALAALRGRKKQFQAISSTLERMQEVERWEAEGIDLDIAFHVAISRASGNPLMIEAVGSLAGRMRQTIAATRQRSGAAIGEVRRLTIVEHAAVRDAIVAGNAEAARSAMLAHITSAAHRLGFDLCK